MICTAALHSLSLRFKSSGNPDCLVRLKDLLNTTVILETKGLDPLAEVKASAAARWVSAVNAEGSYGMWRYEMARSVSSVGEKIAACS